MCCSGFGPVDLKTKTGRYILKSGSGIKFYGLKRYILNLLKQTFTQIYYRKNKNKNYKRII